MKQQMIVFYQLSELNNPKYRTLMPVVLGQPYIESNIFFEVKVASVASIMAFQSLIANPLLDRVLNRHNHSIDMVSLSEKEIKALIAKSKKEKAALEKIARRNVTLARSSTAILMAASIYLLANDEEFSAEFIVVAFTLLSMALNYVIQDATNAYKDYQLKQKMAHLKKNYGND